MLSFGVLLHLRFGAQPGLEPILDDPLAWTLVGAMPLFAALGWVAGDRRRERELSLLQWESAARDDMRTLAQREWLSRGVLQTAFDAVLVLDDEEIILDANPTASRVFGLDVDDLIGLPVAQILPQHRTLGTTLAITRRSAGGEVLGKEWQTQAVHATGHRFPVDLNIVALRGPGLLFYAIREATTRIEAERKRVDDARSAWEAELEVHRRARRTQLLELGASLRSELDRLLEELDLLRDEGVERPALRNTTFALLVVLERLQALSVWERGDASVSTAPIAIHHLVEQVAASVRPLAQHRGSTLEISCDPAIGEVDTDALRLSAAIRALVVNAAIHAEDAEITVDVRLEPGQGTEWLAVAVHDTGPSIADDARERLFGLFRSESDPISVSPGEGLGLRLAHRIARLLCGHVSVSLEDGTTFLLRVPLEREYSIEPGPPRPLRLDSDR